MMKLTAYARREPAISSPGKFDVQIYRDKDATKPMGRFPSHYSTTPKKGRKSVVVNCYRWNLEWLPDAT